MSPEPAVTLEPPSDQSTGTTRKTWRCAALIEEVRLLLPGDHPDAIAARLGYANLGNLTRTLNRNGHHRLAQELITRANWVRYGHDPLAQERRC